MENNFFPKFIDCSDTAFLLVLGDTISRKVHQKVMAIYRILKKHLPDGVVTLVPTYCAVMVVYDPMITVPQRLHAHLENLVRALSSDDPSRLGRVVEIPVCYGGSYGPDLPYVANHCNLTAEEVIALHSRIEYPIFMMGFSPGFPFLGGLDARLHTPRLATPRTRVAAGSVGIADAQTGVYPVETPGGWQLIGRTPLKLFRPDHHMPFRYQVGDRLRFVPIEPEEYLHIHKKEAA